MIAERPGADPNSIILLAAHLDTVFPAGTEVRVKKNGNRLVGPGIADNGAGLAALIGVARALSEGRVRTNKTIIFAGDVGEEGEGNLRGIRALIDAYRPRLAAVIAVDGASTEHITTQGIASHRFEVTITGPGGHSWSDFGAPNPITALARGIVKFSSLTVPEDPRSSYNFGVVEGGTSVNSIPARAIVKVDLRSEEEAEVVKMEASLRDAMQAGIKEEMAARRARFRRATRSEFPLARPAPFRQTSRKFSAARFRSAASTVFSAPVRASNAAPPTPIFRCRSASPPSPSAAAAKPAARTPSTNGTTPPAGNSA